MLSAIALAISTTIGAGVLGLPKALYLMGPWGVAIGLLVAFFLITSAMMLSDMLQRENKPVQLPALLSGILGDRWKYFVYMTLIFSMYGALAAYLIGFGTQLATVAGIRELWGGLLLFAVAGYIIYRGTHVIERINLPLAAALVTFLLALSVFNLTNFSGMQFNSPGLGSVLKFTGTMLFALFGINVIPEINFLSKGRATKVFAISTLISLALYFSFAFTTVGVLGHDTTDLGTLGLAQHYGGAYSLLIFLFTVVALFTSFLGIGLGVRHIYQFDFHLSRIASTAAVMLPPLALFLCSNRLDVGFLDILALAGELTLPLFAVTVAYAYNKVLPAIDPQMPFPRALSVANALFYAGIFVSSAARLIL